MKRVSKLKMLNIIKHISQNMTVNQVYKLYNGLKTERPHLFKNQVRINSLIPPFPSVAFDRFINIVKIGKRNPYQVYLAVTSNCPYKCNHCSYGNRKISNIPTYKIINLIKDIKKLGVSIIGFTGGEPLIRKDLEELIFNSSPEMFTIIFTTGYNLDYSRAKKLAESNVGCVTIGFDSYDEKEHDKIRGKKGSFKTGIKALEACNKADIYTAIGTIATKEKLNNGDLDRIYRLGEEYNVGEIRVISIVPTGSCIKENNLMLKFEEIERIREFHKSYNRRNKGPIVASFAQIESKDMFGCNAGYHHLFIDAAGEVCPCDLTPLSFGNVYEKPLDDIWNDMGKFFTKPRCSCLMGELSLKINTENLPLPPEESKLLMKEIKKDEDLPYMHKIIK